MPCCSKVKGQPPKLFSCLSPWLLKPHLHGNTTGPPPEVNSNQDSGPHSSYRWTELSGLQSGSIAFTRSWIQKTSSRKVVPCKQGLRFQLTPGQRPRTRTRHAHFATLFYMQPHPKPLQSQPIIGCSIPFQALAIQAIAQSLPCLHYHSNQGFMINADSPWV